MFAIVCLHLYVSAAGKGPHKKAISCPAAQTCDESRLNPFFLRLTRSLPITRSLRTFSSLDCHPSTWFENTMAAISFQGVSLKGNDAQVELRFARGEFTSTGRLIPMRVVHEPRSSRTSLSSRPYVGSSTKAVEHSIAKGSSTEADPEHAGFLKKDRALRVALICGGPSAERGISLNSARSVLDHLQSDDVAVSCYYLDQNLFPYRISLAQMYSNTPSDFDYKLGGSERFASMASFTNHLREAVDIVFPLIHGQFGEDGGIQETLEKAGIPFVGTGAAAARRAFDKFIASTELSNRGFATVPSCLFEAPVVDRSAVVMWFEATGLNLDTGAVVVKPASSGSSIGVSVAHGVEEAVEKAGALISEGLGDRVVIEVFIEDGKEFTAIVMDMGLPGNPHPVTLLPTEVELCKESILAEANDAIFNYRRKYLPTNQVLYHTPPRFSNEAIQVIRSGAKEVFKQLKLQDVARIDGWLLPPAKVDANKNKKLMGEFDNGTVVFTDINLVSGMEQTSFLFQQSSQVGLSHARVLRMALLHACRRFQSLSSFWDLPYIPFQKSFVQSRRKKVYVVFGGDTSERQVSLLSGTNVWLNLRKSADFDVIPCLLSSDGSKVGVDNSASRSILSKTVWKLSYAVLLRHTVEEVIEACLKASEPSSVAATAILRGQVMSELEAAGDCMNFTDISLEPPVELTMTEWIDDVKATEAVVFIAVHGGVGENGDLQEILEASNIPYTGSGMASSRVCMDKAESAFSLAHLSSQGVHTIPKDVWNTADILKESENWRNMWESLLRKLNARSICVKPASDGCSTGVARLCCAEDLCAYLGAIEKRLPRLPPNSLTKESGVIELPYPPPERLIFEQFIETAKIKVSSESVEASLDMDGSKWVEITGGLIGKAGEMHALNPSVTIKEQSDILSLEEKFQGGTGINLTPPPSSLMSVDAVNACKKHLELVGNFLQLEGFARIDAFVHVETGEIMVIEVNTVPGMTPSTVLVHQALAEATPMFPHEFFRKVLELAIARDTARVI